MNRTRQCCDTIFIEEIDRSIEYGNDGNHYVDEEEDDVNNLMMMTIMSIDADNEYLKDDKHDDLLKHEYDDDDEVS